MFDVKPLSEADHRILDGQEPPRLPDFPDDGSHLRCTCCGCPVEWGGSEYFEEYYGSCQWETWYCPVCDNAMWSSVFFPDVKGSNYWSFE